jgi:hypothetical protein
LRFAEDHAETGEFVIICVILQQGQSADHSRNDYSAFTLVTRSTGSDADSGVPEARL